MKIATILPFDYMHIEFLSDYHMCLAHLIKESEDYRQFFWHAADDGGFVLMDNGVVETNVPLEIDRLIELSDMINATEVILPDQLNDMRETLRLGEEALKKYPEMRFLSVPQGNTYEEWRACLIEMLDWPVCSIGISRFTDVFCHGKRNELIASCPELIESDKEIHILGCLGVSNELYFIDTAFPDRIRGVDSGVAAIYTQEKLEMNVGVPKPGVELDFHAYDYRYDLLQRNVRFWKRMCKEGL